MGADLGDQGDEDADACDDIDHREDFAGSRCRREVAVADRGERDDRQVEAVDPQEVFDEAIEDGAHRNEDGRDRHHLLAGRVPKEPAKPSEQVTHVRNLKRQPQAFLRDFWEVPENLREPHPPPMWSLSSGPFRHATGGRRPTR